MNISLSSFTGFFSTLQQTVRNAPPDERYAYYALFVGIILFMLGIILKIMF